MASFAQLPLDADPADKFAPSFLAHADSSEPLASFVRADPVLHVDNEQQILCGRRVLLSGSFGSARALFGATSDMMLCAVDCTMCDKQWCAHVARLLQRLSLRQQSASLAPSAFDFLAGRPRKRRPTPLLQNKRELQPMLDRLFGNYDSTLDDTQLSAVARFIDGDRSSGSSASVPRRRERIGPVELDYENGGWRLCDESELLAVGSAAGKLTELYDVTQAYARGSSAFFALSRKLDNFVVRCSISAALGPTGVFGFRCECASVGVLCEHLCRVLSCVGVPPVIDVGSLFHSLGNMTLTEHCGLLARIIMRAKTLGIDRSLVVPLDRLASATTVLQINTGALPVWSIAQPGAYPAVLMATQLAEPDNKDLLVATLTRAYRGVSLRISHERLVGAHCDECGRITCQHVVAAMRDFVFYARGGYGGIPVHATSTVGGGADAREATAPVLLSYDAIVRTLSQRDLPSRCELLALAMRDVRQIQSPNVAKRCAQLFADVVAVDAEFPSSAMVNLRDFDQCVQMLVDVEHICSSAAYLDALCVVSFNFPQRETELKPLWTTFMARARGDEIYQCVHAGRALLPRALGVCLVEVSLLALQKHMRLDESARQSFVDALYTRGGDVELASQQLLAVPDAVRARAPFRLVANIEQVDPIGAVRAGVTPLFEAAMFLLPGGMVRTPVAVPLAERPSTPASAPGGQLLTTLISPADTASLAEARRGLYAPAYSRQEMAAMIEKCPSDGGVLPVLMLLDVSLRHSFANCAFLEQLRRKLFTHVLAQLGFVFAAAMPEEANYGALRAVVPLSARALDAMAMSMADIVHYSGTEARDIVQATPSILRKSLLVRMLMSRLALCSVEVVQSVFPAFFAWLATHKLYSLQAMLAVVYGRYAGIEERVKASACEHALTALKLAFEVDSKRAVSSHFLRDLMAAFPSRVELVWAACTSVGQGAMLLEHLLATPTLWPQLGTALVDDDDEARTMLRHSSVQRQLSALLVAANGSTMPPASFLTRVRELLPEGSGSSCALLLVRAPDATDEQRKSAIVDLLAQTSDDETVLSQLGALSQDALVLLSQARICEQADRARLAALVLVTTFESASLEANDMAMFVPESEALFTKLVAREDFDLLEVLLEPRATRFLQFALKMWAPLLVDRHASSASGARRAFAVECFNRSVGSALQAAVRAATGAAEDGCRNSRCSECAVCTQLVRMLRRAMVWANLANRVFEFDRTRSAVASELTEKRKQKLANVISSIRNDVELTLIDED